MPNGKTVGTEVTPEFDARIERIKLSRGDSSKSQTVRHLLREGSKKYEQQSFAQTFFKWAAIGLAVAALVVFAYGDATGYARPAAMGAWIMVPAIVSIGLYDAWPRLSSMVFGTPAEAAEA